MFDCQLLTLQTASNRALLRRSNLRSRQVGFLFVISVCLLVLVSTSVPYFLQWRGVPPHDVPGPKCVENRRHRGARWAVYFETSGPGARPDLKRYLADNYVTAFSGEGHSREEE